MHSLGQGSEDLDVHPGSTTDEAWDSGVITGLVFSHLQNEEARRDTFRDVKGEASPSLCSLWGGGYF